MSRAKRGRGLSAHERALWDKVVADATPMAKRADPSPSPPPPTPDPAPPAAPAPEIPEGFRLGARVDDARAGLQGSTRLPAPPAPALDKKVHRRLRRGDLRPEARIDLHGMTAADAHPALMRFVADAHAAGKRLVLVITGKGKDRDRGGPIPVPAGVLRREVPQWLNAPAMRPLVLDIATAHRRHGGSGAYYVYLRRPR